MVKEFINIAVEIIIKENINLNLSMGLEECVLRMGTNMLVVGNGTSFMERGNIILIKMKP